MFIKFISISFLIIFNLTALLALASLPGWISIDEKYKKPLFYGLIVEVVLFIISFATLNILDNKRFAIPDDENWIALNLDNYSYIQPEITINRIDTKIVKNLGKSYAQVERQLMNNPLSGKFMNKGILVNINDSMSIGYIGRENLLKLNLFNSLSIDNKKEITHTTISFERQQRRSKLWETSFKFDNLPFEIKVIEGDHGTQYELWSDSKETYNSVNSRNPEKGTTSIDLHLRVNHIFRTSEKYYLLYIQSADLRKRYIHFALIEFKPLLKL